ncbi:MAG TPA: histidine kinase [Rhizomicrobium sp.]|jgi:two-component system sensor histidine kinase UhpB|nr:histidine kinase [Rhizomicrobium sp.]
MSLRFRLVSSISAILLVALAFGGLLVCWRATNSVQVEMKAALTGAEDVVRQALTRHDYRPGSLTALVMSFNGQRHVRAMLFYPPHTLAARSRLAQHGELAPAWFNALVGVRPQTVRIPLAGPAHAGSNGVILLRTDPANEIAEVWRQAVDGFAVMLLFCGGTLVLIFTIVGRSLRDFTRFQAAFREISEGHYEAGLSEEGPPEFASLAQGFNQMARRLCAHQTRIGELHEQLLTLQEDERADVARDLHDEVGPYLFAINVDADAIPGLVEEKATDEIAERASAIRESVAHIQKHVKSILRQLRPAHALEFGLETAICDIADFWKRRNPEIRFSVRAALDGTTLDRAIEDAAYRIVQESVSNAVRHGRPNAIGICISLRRPTGIVIRVSDDGEGLRPGVSGRGMGLMGMAERVNAFKGSLAMTSGDGGRGAVITATLPAVTDRRLQAESVV